MANPSAGGRYIVEKPGTKPVRVDKESTSAPAATPAAPPPGPDKVTEPKPTTAKN